MILIRANTERQILVIRATLVSAPRPSKCLEIRLWSAAKEYSSSGLFGTLTTEKPTMLIINATDVLETLIEVFTKADNIWSATFNTLSKDYDFPLLLRFLGGAPTLKTIISFCLFIWLSIASF